MLQTLLPSAYCIATMYQNLQNNPCLAVRTLQLQVLLHTSAALS